LRSVSCNPAGDVGRGRAHQPDRYVVPRVQPEWNEKGKRPKLDAHHVHDPALYPHFAEIEKIPNKPSKLRGGPFFMIPPENRP
jgi:hypothetical protein